MFTRLVYFFSYSSWFCNFRAFSLIQLLTLSATMLSYSSSFSCSLSRLEVSKTVFTISLWVAIISCLSLTIIFTPLINSVWISSSFKCGVAQCSSNLWLHCQILVRYLSVECHVNETLALNSETIYRNPETLTLELWNLSLEHHTIYYWE